MATGLKVTCLPDMVLTVVADLTARVTYDLVNWELVVITPTAGGTAFGQIATDTLVPASWAGGARRFGTVPSTEVVTVGSGARRWGAVPSDESVPADSDWTT